MMWEVDFSGLDRILTLRVLDPDAGRQPPRVVTTVLVHMELDGLAGAFWRCYSPRWAACAFPTLDMVGEHLTDLLEAQDAAQRLGAGE